MPRGYRIASFVGVASLLLVVMSGCEPGQSGPPTAHLQGTITINGQPIPGHAAASITIKPTSSDQANSTSAQIKSSKYDMPDVPLGPVMVYIDAQEPTGRQVTENVSRPYDEYRSLIPSEHQGGFALEVEGDNPDQNFEL